MLYTCTRLSFFLPLFLEFSFQTIVSFLEKFHLLQVPIFAVRRELVLQIVFFFEGTPVVFGLGESGDRFLLSCEAGDEVVEIALALFLLDGLVLLPVEALQSNTQA